MNNTIGWVLSYTVGFEPSRIPPCAATWVAVALVAAATAALNVEETMFCCGAEDNEEKEGGLKARKCQRVDATSLQDYKEAPHMRITQCTWII